jgi:hypothetical protein
VPDNEKYNDNLGNNFVSDLTIFRNKLPPITNVDPIEIINLPVENKYIPAEQPEDSPLPEIPEEQTLQEIDEEIQMFREKRLLSLKRVKRVAVKHNIIHISINLS